jgi:LAS superfamily LD-carboxypeptidase LdcB
MFFFARIFLAGYAIALSIAQGYSQTPTKAFLTGHFDYTRDTSFVRVDNKYTTRDIYLKKQTYAAYKKMYAAALKDGVELSIMSGTRSFNDQVYKWELKWHSAEFSGIKNLAAKTTKLLRWWSMPGTSRHHWGTDIDLANIKLAYYKTPPGERMYAWLKANAAKFGFYQPFCAGRCIGYREERWHWSYLPLSKNYLHEYIRQVTYADIFGFDGSKTAEELGVIKNWVQGINPVCK